ncbi:MAG: 16S rRNA (cytidine(1402)-2'-O)-methyltransferase [Nannocystaceae bacterium]
MLAPGQGVLVLVGTPLGNRGDLSPRARDAILSADLILCEDTRSPTRLFATGMALPPRVSCFAARESQRSEQLHTHLAEGKRVVFVSEAGMPVWSDPGARLVQAAVAGGFEVDVIPGPTAAATALCLSGFSGANVRFAGFLARSGKSRTDALTRIASDDSVTIVYEAGNRVPALLRDLAAAMGEQASKREIVIGRELTKMHQQVLRGSVAELHASTREPLRGEVTVVIAGGKPVAGEEQDQARAVWEAVCEPALKPRARARRIAELTGLPSGTVYEQLVATGLSSRRD